MTFVCARGRVMVVVRGCKLQQVPQCRNPLAPMVNHTKPHIKEHIRSHTFTHVQTRPRAFTCGHTRSHTHMQAVTSERWLPLREVRASKPSKPCVGQGVRCYFAVVVTQAPPFPAKGATVNNCDSQHTLRTIFTASLLYFLLCLCSCRPIQVSPRDLPAYLIEMRAAGYLLVGVEQAAGSVPLQVGVFYDVCVLWNRV